MSFRCGPFPLFIFALTLSFGAGLALGQVPSRPADQPDEVIRVNSELVQSDVTVVDSKGRFVEGLTREQFELKVNGRPQAISFFEQVTAGSTAEARQLSSTRGQTTVAVTAPAPADPEPGRIIFFYVDDVHLDGENIIRTRQAIAEFIENRMRPGDRVAVVSTSGRIGFLQQLTSNKTVLREAISRLRDQRRTEPYAGKVVISEFEADQVANAHNQELFRYLVLATAAEFQMDLLTAANMVRNRVSQVESQGRISTSDTLTTLEGLMRSSAPLPGRKIVFFVSAGFVMDPRSSDVFDRMRRLTKTAAQVGAVIYTMDARGGFVDTHTDASQNPYPDYTGTVSRDVFAEGQATQEPLRVLSNDTGGRAFLNSNSFSDAFDKGLTDASNYYLLAWQPERDDIRTGRARLKVSIIGRPDLKVRLRRDFTEVPPVLNTNRTVPALTPEAELLAALGSIYPVRSIPLSLAVGYVNTAGHGVKLTATMQLDFTGMNDGTQKSEVDVIGVALDDRGSIASFRQKLSITPEVILRSGHNSVVWNQQLVLRPGLYQVRVAVRDRQTGRLGSAMQWIEIPTTPAGTFSLSSIFLGGRNPTETSATAKVQVNASGRFRRQDRLRYQLIAYIVSGGPEPGVSAEVRIFHQGESVMSIAPAKIQSKSLSEPTQIPIAGEIALAELPAGRYVLQIVVTDNKGGSSMTRQAEFIVE